MVKRNTPKAAAITPKLTPEVAAMVKGMLGRRDRQSDIAAFFQINQGRIVEINSGQRFRDVPAAPLDQLPEPGPYVVVSRTRHERQALAEARLAKITAVLERAMSGLNSDIAAVLREDA